MRRFALLGLLVPVLAFAAQQPPLDLDKVTTQQRQIRTDIQSSNGHYRGISAKAQAEVIQRQDRLLRMFEGKQTYEDLSEEQRLLAFNDLEWIESTLNKEDDDRMICRKERTLGSNRLKRVCRTAKQMAEESERAREDLDNSQRNTRSP